MVSHEIRIFARSIVSRANRRKRSRRSRPFATRTLTPRRRPSRLPRTLRFFWRTGHNKRPLSSKVKETLNINPQIWGRVFYKGKKGPFLRSSRFTRMRRDGVLIGTGRHDVERFWCPRDETHHHRPREEKRTLMNRRAEEEKKGRNRRRCRGTRRRRRRRS